MQTITLDKREYRTPSSLNELPTSSLRALCAMAHAGLGGHSIALSMVLRHLQLRPGRLAAHLNDGKALVVTPRGRYIRRCIRLADVHTLIMSQGYLFQDGNPFAPIATTLTNPHAIPLRGGLKAPGEALEEATLGQFLTAESLRLNPENNPETPPDPTVWFAPLLRNANDTPATTAQVMRALKPHWVKEAITLYYASSLEALKGNFPSLFTRAETPRQNTPNGGPITLVYQLAQGDPLRVQPLMETPLYHALITLATLSQTHE